jgi:hypothetical protein
MVEFQDVSLHKPNVRMYDQLRVPCHFCIDIKSLLKIEQSKPYSLKKKLHLLTQANTAIEYTSYWARFNLVILSIFQCLSKKSDHFQHIPGLFQNDLAPQL